MKDGAKRRLSRENRTWLVDHPISHFDPPADIPAQLDPAFYRDGFSRVSSIAQADRVLS
jgi:hypothetical protein